MILIIDFGSQTTHLIGKRITDMGIKVMIVEPEIAMSSIKNSKPKGIILSGGPAFVNTKDSPTIDKKIFSLKIPILAICYGWQLTAHLLNGEVKAGNKEYGPANLEIELNGLLFQKVDSYSVVWMSHGDTVYKLPKGFIHLGKTQSIKYAAAADISRKIYGIQFHPEVDHTIFGLQILKNFVTDICLLKIKKHEINIKKIISDIKKKVGTGKVICAVSGGVDSTVAASLIGKAIGKNLIPVYIESGLMREGTKNEVEKIFYKLLKIKPIIVEARDIFLKKLKGVKDGEEKRKIIGKLYIDLFKETAKKFSNIEFLAQGTIYSDVIESKGTRHSSKIKSHHNVGGLPEEIGFKLLEPLRYFYKDEVRKIGELLGLSEELIKKQVFPGPGYGIRIIGEITKERLEKIYKADEIVVEEIKKSGLYNKIYMSFAILTDTFSTAVKGDGRELLEVVALRIIESSNVMTTTWARIPYDLMQSISSRIVNEVPGVSRVVYDITTKPPATMEWE